MFTYMTFLKFKTCYCCENMDKGPKLDWMEYGMGSYKSYSLFVPESDDRRIVVAAVATRSIVRQSTKEPVFVPKELNYDIDWMPASTVSSKIFQSDIEKFVETCHPCQVAQCQLSR